MDEERLIELLLRRVGELGERQASGAITSRTLRASLRLIVDTPDKRARLFVPHYWALYFHDGRRGFSAGVGRFIVFFADPADDPRIQSGFPERASQIRRLTRAEFQAGLAENRMRRFLGQEPFMYVLPAVGPATGQPFFDNNFGMRGFSNEAGCLIAVEFDRWVQDNLVQTERRTARFDI